MRNRGYAKGVSFWLASPLVGLLIPSAYVASLFAFRIVALAQPLVDQNSLVYFIISILFMLSVSLFTLLVSSKSKSVRLRRIYSVVDWIPLWKPFLILSLVAGLFTALDFIYSMKYPSFNLYLIRQGFADRNTTPMAYLSNLLAPFSVMLLGTTLILFEELRRSERVLGIVVGIGVPVLLSVGLAGRSNIVNLVIMIPWWLLQRPVFGKSIFPGHRLGHDIVMVIIVLLITSWLLIFISTERSQKGEQQFNEIISLNQAAVTTSASFTGFILTINPSLATGFAEAVYYWTSPIAAFDKLYTGWQLAPDYMSAMSPILQRRLAVFGGASPEAISLQKQVILSSYNIFPNMFTTAPFGLIISYGRIGAFIAQGLIAVLACLIYVYARKTHDFAHMYFASLLYLAVFLWFQGIITIYPINEYGIYWCIAFMLLGLQRKRTLVRLEKTVRQW